MLIYTKKLEILFRLDPLEELYKFTKKEAQLNSDQKRKQSSQINLNLNDMAYVYFIFIQYNLPKLINKILLIA